MSQFDEDGIEYPPDGDADDGDADDGEDATLDSEVDFDDESDDDQLPLDEVEAGELGVNLDDPERLSDE